MSEGFRIRHRRSRLRTRPQDLAELVSLDPFQAWLADIQLKDELKANLESLLALVQSPCLKAAPCFSVLANRWHHGQPGVGKGGPVGSMRMNAEW